MECPTPQKRSRGEDQIADDEDEDQVIGYACKGNRCPFCGPVKANKYLIRALQGYRRERKNHPSVIPYAVTLMLRRGAGISVKATYKILKTASRAVDGLRRRSRCKITYLAVLHPHLPFPDELPRPGRGHLHMLLLITPLPGQQTPTKDCLRQWLFLEWNRQASGALGRSRQKEYDPETKIGGIYLDVAVNVRNYLEYILLGGQGKSPWVDTWLLPPKVRRVRSSRGFLLKPS